MACEVVDGGVLSSHKAECPRRADLTAEAMTDKDRADLRFGLDLGVDYVALSFVRRQNLIGGLPRQPLASRR